MSVRLSGIMSKRLNISSNFSSSVATPLVFLHQTLRQYSDGDTSNGGVECKWGMKKLQFSTNISLYLEIDRR